MKKFFLVFLLFFSLLFTIEIISKILLSSYYKNIIRSYNVDYSFSEKSLIGDIIPNQKKFELNYGDRPFSVYINDVGSRNSLDFCKECKNIYVFGDSQTFGLFINQSDTFVEKIQNKLYERWRIYNLGATGTNITDALEQYHEKFLSKVKDSTIIYLFGFSDIEGLPTTTGSKRSKIKKYNNSLFSKIKSFLKKYLATYELLSVIKNKDVEKISLAKYNELILKSNLIDTININKLNSIGHTKMFSLFDKHLIEFNNLAKNDNNNFIAIYGPTYTDIDDKNFQIEKYLNSERNYTLLNLKKKFSTYDLRDISHYDVHDQKLSERYVNDAHYTRLANNLIADFIYDYLIDSGILIKH